MNSVKQMEFQSEDYFEVVSGQIKLEKRDDFFRIHKEILLPIMAEVQIQPVLLLLTEIGRFGRFLDVYRYRDLTEYQQKTDSLMSHPRFENYYKVVGECIEGSIVVELMKQFPYASSSVHES